MKITKKQIKEAYNDVSKLKEWYPEAFEIKLEVGKWYKSTLNNTVSINKALIYISEIHETKIYGYGFDFAGIWFNYSNDCATVGSHLVKATDKEIKTALVNEAKKRGFEGYVSFKPVGGLSILNPRRGGFGYDSENNVLLYANYCIFKDGTWATIIKPKQMTKEQIETELGYKIEIV